MSSDSPDSLDRRAVLHGIAGASVASLAGCGFFEREEDSDVRAVDDDRALALAEAYAPTIYFDHFEQWFPTDPRHYESERDGETVVDGFDALEGYTSDSAERPSPTVFYHVVQYEDSPLVVVQFWFYSVFDQFTTNFHWHDWELLQVFVDTETDQPQLYVASAHSRKAPNNEYLDPDPERRPRILTELGSHSSGLSINDDEEQFQRLPLDGDVADITNSVIDGVEDIAAIPLAYGLPRDEGLTLPYAVPELDGAPVYDHQDLPSVGPDDLIAESLTIGSFDELRSPPEDLPERSTGVRFEYQGRDVPDANELYDLVSTSDVEHIAEFTGPQLSFEFRIPQVVEDQIASHITTTGVPWEDPRYETPGNDISETDHRQALANRYEAIGNPAPVQQVIASVTNAVSSEDAPESEGLTTTDSPIEYFAFFQSEPEAVPTFQGLAVLQDVPAGEHTLTVNGAGVAPHSETVRVPDEAGNTVAGAEGEIPLVARENATKLELDPGETDADLRDFAIEDDFAGRMFGTTLSGPEAVYVHDGGAYTAEVRDTDDEVGAYRVNPGEEDRIRVENPTTGKAPLATYLADVAEETRAQVAAVAGDEEETAGGPGSGGQGNAVQGLARALAAVVEAAERAAENARRNDRTGTDQQLEAVANRLERVSTRLAEARGSLPDELGNAADRRLDQASRRAEQARNAEKL